MRKSIVILAGAVFALLASPSSALVGITPILLSGCLYDGGDVCDDALTEAYTRAAGYCGADNVGTCFKTEEEEYAGVTISCEYDCLCGGN